MLHRRHSKWLSLFIVAALVPMLLVQGGAASAATQLPVIHPDGGSFTTAQTVTISNIAHGSTVHYTTDKSNPKTSSTAVTYTGAFTVSQSETVRAAAYDPVTGWSAIASAVFSISGSSLEAPVIHPDGGAFTTAQSVTIGNIPHGYTAYYTTDGSNPKTSGTATPYTGAFRISQSETVRAAVHGPSGWSSIASATFVIDSQSDSDGDRLAQLKKKFAAAINNDQMAQAMQILQQIQQLVRQDSDESRLNKLKEQLIDAANSEKWAKAEEILKQILKIENSDWAYTQLGQMYRQQGNNNINVFSNGGEINFDVRPIIVNGRTLIPIRQVATAFGLSDNNVNWNPNGTVTIDNGSNQILICNNARQVYLNGASYDTDVPAQIVDGRMMVPLRAVGQLFHKNVQWYPDGKIVSIS